jgi:hypothetical protein
MLKDPPSAYQAYYKYFQENPKDATQDDVGGLSGGYGGGFRNNDDPREKALEAISKKAKRVGARKAAKAALTRGRRVRGARRGAANRPDQIRKRNQWNARYD